MPWEILPTKEAYEDEIRRGEALAETIRSVAALLIHPSTAKLYGLLECEKRLFALRDAIGNYLCELPRRWIKELAEKPLPSPEEMHAKLYPKPTIEQLMQASKNVEMLETALEKLSTLENEFAAIVVRPQLEMQLLSAQSYLSSLQKAMEEDLPMSNKSDSAEAAAPE